MVYLDYAATTPLLPEVIAATRRAETTFFANASALHTPGHLALNEIEATREALATLVNVAPSEIIFTSGASESNNTVIRTFAGQEIISSPLEHHSIIEPAKLFAKKYSSCDISALKTPVKNSSKTSSSEDSSKSSASLSPSRLYSFMLANNEIGEILDLPAVIRHAHAENSYVHSDLTQVLGKIPLNLQKLDLDYATFSAHKIGGPVGVGALYVKTGAPFKPLILGGNQEKKRRGGTYNTVGIIGFKAALDFVAKNRTWELYETKVRPLRDLLARRILAEIPGASLNTALENCLPNILNVSFEAAEGESIQLYLDAEDIIVSTGSACAAGDIKPSHVLMAKTGDAEVAHSSIRFSFGLDNTKEDVDKVMSVLPGIIARLQGMSTIKMKGNYA